MKQYLTMTLRHSVCLGMLLLVFTGPATLALADNARQDIVHIFVDVKDGTWYRYDGIASDTSDAMADLAWKPIKGKQVAIPTAKKIVVGAMNTNTAWYEHRTAAKRITIEDKETLFDFLRDLKDEMPYLLDEAVRDDEKHIGALAETETDDSTGVFDPLLVRLGAAIFGPQGLRDIHYQVRKALRNTDPGKIRSAIEDAATCRTCKPEWSWFEETPGPEKLRITSELAKIYDALQVKLTQYRGKEDADFRAASRALDESREIMRSAYALEREVVIAAHASRTWKSVDTLGLSWSGGHDVTITLNARGDEFLSRPAELDGAPYTIRIVPWWPVKPSLGISLYYADAARFEETDASFGYGINFGLAPSAWRNIGDGPVSIWLPELTIVPESSQRAIGLGGAISYGILKLGSGWIWVRHQEGEHETYGKGLLYFSISLYGIPPFVE